MPIELVVRVTGNATQELDKVAAALGRMGQEAQRTGSRTTEAEGASRRADASFGALARTLTGGVAAVTGIGLGIQVVQRVLSGALGAMTSFETALANVNSLGIQNADTQARLREQILQINPALGSSTQLARGLYDVLSSGVSATQSVGFLEVNARLARAGLADLSTTVTATTKVMAGFQIPTSQAADVADVLFQTVNVGQGTLQEFASAFPVVSQQASALGISLNDTASGLAVLSTAFQSPQAAATGLRSLFGNLVQHADQFAARGVNLREVIGQRGLTGVLDVLRQVTHSNVEELRTFVSDVEGQQAALALLGPQAERFATAQRQIGSATGSVSAGLREQLRPLQAQWDTLVGSLERTAQQVAPAVTGSLGALLGGVQVLTVGFGALLGQLTRLTQVPIEATLDLFARASGTNLAALDAAAAAAKQRADAAQQRLLQIRDIARLTGTEITRETAQGLNLSQEAINRAKQNAQELANAYVGLRAQTLVALREQADGAVQNFQRILAAGQEPPQRIRQFWEEARTQIIAAYGSIPPALQPLDRRILTQVDATVAGLREAWKTLGLPAPEERERIGQQTIAAFEAIAVGGNYSAEQTRQAFERAFPAIIEQYGALPPRFATIDAQIRSQVDTTTEGIRAAYTRLRVQSTEELQRGVDAQVAAFLALVPAVGTIPPQLQPVWERIRDEAIAAYGVLPARFQEIDQRIVGQADTTERGVVAAYKRLGLQSEQEIQRSVTQQVAAFQSLVPQGENVTDALRQRWLQLREAIIAAYGSIPPALQQYDQQIMQSADRSATGLQAIYQRFGARTQEALRDTALTAIREFQAIVDGGQVHGSELERIWVERVLPRIKEAGFRTLPPEARTAHQAVVADARANGQAYDAAWTPAIRGVGQRFAEVVPAAQQAAEQVLASANRGSAAYAAAWQQVGGAGSSFFAPLPPAAEEAHGQIVSSGRQASSEYARNWQGALNQVSDAVRQVADRSAAALHDIRITTETSFSNTLAGLQEQLRQVLDTTTQIRGGTFGGAAISFASREALLRNQAEIEAAIRARIAALTQQTTQTGGATAPATPPAPRTPPPPITSTPAGIGGLGGPPAGTQTQRTAQADRTAPGGDLLRGGLAPGVGEFGLDGQSTLRQTPSPQELPATQQSVDSLSLLTEQNAAIVRDLLRSRPGEFLPGVGFVPAGTPRSRLAFSEPTGPRVFTESELNAPEYASLRPFIGANSPEGVTPDQAEIIGRLIRAQGGAFLPGVGYIPQAATAPGGLRDPARFRRPSLSALPDLQGEADAGRSLPGSQRPQGFLGAVGSGSAASSAAAAGGSTPAGAPVFSAGNGFTRPGGVTTPVGGFDLSAAFNRGFVINGGIVVNTQAQDAYSLVRDMAGALREAVTRGDLSPNLPGRGAR